MPLNAQSQAVLAAMQRRKAPPIWQSPVDEVRRRMEALYTTDVPSPPIHRTEAMTIPCAHGGLGVRVYTPEGTGPFPVMVYFHGGGWVYNSLDTHDAPLRLIAAAAGCVIVSVAYRLAPEHPYPAAVEDAWTATLWTHANAARLGADPGRLIVGGDSAGGNLAAVTAQIGRDWGWPGIARQVLIYPNTDHVYGGFASIEAFGSGYSLARDGMIWFANHYIPWTEDLNNPYICPLRAASLAGLPEALVLTAECDALLDEGKAYADRLREAGVPVRYLEGAGMMHGFMLFWHRIDSARDALMEVSRFTREGWDG